MTAMDRALELLQQELQQAAAELKKIATDVRNMESLVETEFQAKRLETLADEWD